MFLRVGNRVHNIIQATSIDLGGDESSPVVVHFGEDRGGGIPLRGVAAAKVRQLFTNGEVRVIDGDEPPPAPAPVPIPPTPPAPSETTTPATPSEPPRTIVVDPTPPATPATAAKEEPAETAA